MKALLWLLLGAVLITSAEGKDKSKGKQTSPLDLFVSESQARSAEAPPPAAGSLWSPGSRLADAARDLRASQVDDVLTVTVVESATAISKGSTKTKRSSSTANTITKLAGATNAAGALANLSNLSGATSLDGEGTTSRDMVISTTLTARVAAVLQNGSMLIEATKDIMVNSERQIVTVRGVARPADIDSTNTIRSDRLAQLEVRLNGKGVVGDAVRRPMFLYRLLLGLLPF
jgi:flagellar L-ring protein FlgH